MLDKFLRISRYIFLAHVIAGFVAIVALAIATPWVIGEGRFHSFVRDVELYDFKWWLVSVAALGWVLPIIMVMTWRNAKRAGLEAASVKAHVRELLEGRSFPVVVDVDTVIPVKIERQLEVDFSVQTKVDVDDRIDIEGTIPLVTELPIDTEISTSVFGLGTVKIPIKARIPLNITIPLKTTMHVRAKGIPINLAERAKVELPAMEIPIKSRLEARIDILRTIETVDPLKLVG